MRFLWTVAVLSATRAMADPAPATDPPPTPVPAAPSPALDTSLHPGFTLRAGFHHTRIRNDDLAGSGYGPTIEFEATLHPIEFLSVGALLANARYNSFEFHDTFSNVDREASHDMWSLGGRIYVHPHWRAFLGVAIYQQWETADFSDLYGEMPTYSDLTAQLIAGVNVVRLDRMMLQLAATYTSYGRSGGGDVTTYGVALGIHGE